MSDQEPELGRFKPNPDEPREPFLPDEMIGPQDESDSPSLSSLHLPKSPLTKESLKVFLIELKPIIVGIQKLSRKDQHLMVSYFQDVKNKIQSGDFSDDVERCFEKVAEHFGKILTHSAPIDQEAVLSDISKLETML